MVWSAGPPGRIAVPFTLSEPGYVTLVIEDTMGRRVRNLISETKFEAGPQVAYWDGLDDVGRARPDFGHYAMSAKLVHPGEYRVRGLVRPEINLRYLFTIDNPGQPPWASADKASEWLANHTPPSAVMFVPGGQAPVREGQQTSAGGQILVGPQVTEGGSALAWLDLDGKKLHGQMWMGGVWTGPTGFARDLGDHPISGVYVYAGTVWEDELRLHALVPPDQKKDLPLYAGQGGHGDGRFGSGEDAPVLSPNLKLPKMAEDEVAGTSKNPVGLRGLAAHNGVVVASVPQSGGLVFADAREGKLLGVVPLKDARGIAFDPQGRLLVLVGRRLVRYPEMVRPVLLPAPETLISTGLDDPQGLCLDERGNFFVSDGGDSQQVKVFSPEGKLVRTIGVAGKPKLGTYDPGHMRHPAGITLDDRGRLWVAEADSVPKRISVWSAADGKLVRAFYGPMEYGGGGQLDPGDPSRFFYSGVEFHVDWKTGQNEPVMNYYREEFDHLGLKNVFKGRAPEQPIHAKGRLYLTDCYNTSPTNGTDTAAIWRYEGGVARPVAALGAANDWKRTREDGFRQRLPAGAEPEHAWFLWTDTNGDGMPQPEETQFFKGDAAGITVGLDLSFVASNIDGKAYRFAPTGFSAGGVPRYDLNKREVLAEGTRSAITSGGGQALAGRDGWTVLTVPPEPYPEQAAVAGVCHGKVLWQYPSLWPGLHPSHDAPLPDHPGELIGTTRLLGGLFTPKSGEAGEMWAINGNKGNVYLFTTDGLFVATLFKDGRQASWDAPKAERGRLVHELSLGEENFWPSIQQTADGQIFLTGGGSGGSVIGVEGLEGVRRLPQITLTLTAQDVRNAKEDFTRRELERQQREVAKAAPLTVRLRAEAPVVDGKLDDWQAENFVEIDGQASAAVSVSGERLFAAWKTGNDRAVENSGETWRNLFKTGGGLDLMLDAVPGGERLLIGRVKEKTVAVLYRAKVAGTREPVKFTSNIGTLATTIIDRVEDVSGEVQFARSEGNYEVSVPLKLLGWKPKVGAEIRGDIGLLRGNGFQTLQRVYWHNKATGLMSDLASEAELTPLLWGTWRVESR